MADERSGFDAAWVGEFVRAVMAALEPYQFPTGTVDFDMAVDWRFSDDGDIRLVVPSYGTEGLCRLRFTAVHPDKKEND